MKKRSKRNYLLKSSERITTNKMRVISRNQQMMRLDSETVLPLTTRAGTGTDGTGGAFYR